jgi:transglutaminase-like putative cysteine protease
MERANQLEQSGSFNEAAKVLKSALADAQPNDQKQMEFALDRLERIRKDFPYTREQLFIEVSKGVKDLSRAEFDEWIKQGRFDSRNIDGKRLFMSASLSNLFFRYPEVEVRRVPPKDTAEFQRSIWTNCAAIRKASLREGKPYVLPKRFQVTMSVTAKEGAVPPGETISAWLPLPRVYPFQNNVEVVTSSSPIKHLDEDISPIRCGYLEQAASKKGSTQFWITYNYTTYGVHFELSPEKVVPCDRNDSHLKPFLTEAPHVVFTSELRALSAAISGEESNPYLKAKRFYEWIAANIKYSYAIEYSTIANISEYCRSRQYGDCGQEALLFIALCRLNGIPARWQSGWNTVPGGKTIHDWSEIYIAPYGWMPVDPYMGIYAERYAKRLTVDQRREVRDFYFGGLDQYRMAANSDHNQGLTPPKRSMRSDDVDFQRGELEWGNHNIYFDQYSWKLDWKEISSPHLD